MTDRTDDPEPTTGADGAPRPRVPDTGPPAASAGVRSANEAASRERVDDLVSRSRVRSDRMAGRRDDLTARRERDADATPQR